MSTNKVQPVVPGLCGSCRHAIITESCTGSVTLRCGAVAMTPEVKRAMARCSAWLDKNHPTFFDMQQIAWELKTNEKNRVGFTPPTRPGGAEVSRG